MGSFTRFLHKILVSILVPLSVSGILFTLFSFISTYLFRLQGNGGYLNNNFEHTEVISEESNQKESTFIQQDATLEQQQETKNECVGFADSENAGEEKKPEGFSFTFRFATFEEFSRSKREDSDLFNAELVSSTSARRYDFMPGKSCSGFIEEPEVLSFKVKQVSLHSSHNGNFEDGGNQEIINDRMLPDEKLKQVAVQAAEVFDEQVDENTINDLCDGEEKEKIEAAHFVEEMADPVKEEHNFLGGQEFYNEVQFRAENKSKATDCSSDSQSFSSEQEHSDMDHLIDSYSDGFLSDGNFGGEFEFDHLMDVSGEKAESSRGELLDLEKYGEYEGFDEENSDILEELSRLEQDHVKNPNVHRWQFLCDRDFHEDLDKDKSYEFEGKDDMSIDGSHDSEKATSKESSDFGDANKLETLWEHQELIEQLKMELKKVRATGLPTILEESESPKITEDLKPWKIDEKFQHEGCMDELHKFYKSYRERMRKFDIFNYQKMYAMGFLQQKDPLQSVSSRRPSGPTLKSLLSQSFGQLKHKISDSEPMVKFVKELQSDLEVVYVGQMCLSWEFLHWQYGKALDLWDSDPRGIHRYNEVAGEFQQFQVLMQRFIEDELFQGPRVQYYTKCRCINRNLLQVPVIKEDNLKDRRKGRKSEKAEYAITSDMLVEIMEESIRILWRFIGADKDSCSTIVKGHKGLTVQLQNPGDSELLMEIRKILQKKERKLKDILRSGNCILKRFRKGREDDSDHVLYFFSQVDMKLVSRVLNMSKITTDQLVWCHSKLSRISFEHRKIHVEPSFLLFPC